MWVSKTLMFAGTCPARGEVTLVSQRISRPFRTRRFSVRFPVGCINLLAVSFYMAQDDEAPAAGRPSGISILQDYGQVGLVRGDGVQIVLDHVVAGVAAGAYIKVYASNGDFFDHAVDVDIEIEVEDEGS